MYQKNNVKKIMLGVLGIVCATVTGCSADRGDAVTDKKQTEIETTIATEKEGTSEEAGIETVPIDDWKYIWEEQDYTSLSYTDVNSVYQEKFGIYTLPVSTVRADVGTRRYYFEADCTPEDRTACIEATEALLGRIGYEGRLSVYIYMPDTYSDTYMDDEMATLNVPLQDFKSADYAVKVLLAATGRYANYGAAYAYAELLCNSIWENAGDDSQIAEPEFNPEWNCYDLNILCFDTQFVSEEETEEALAVSRSFVRDYIEKNGDTVFYELLKKSAYADTCGAFGAALSEWYAGKGFELPYELSDILFAYGGHSYQYIAAGTQAVFYVDKDFKDEVFKTDYNMPYGENFLHEDYAETERYFRINNEEMEQYIELLGIEKVNVNVILSNRKLKAADNYSICNSYCFTVITSYLDAVCMPDMATQAWLASGWSGALWIKYNEYVYDFYAEDYAYAMETFGDKWSFLSALTEKKGRPLKFPEDYREVMDLCTYNFDEFDLSTTRAVTSFVLYLIDVYGEDEVIDAVMRQHDITTLSGESRDEMVEEWTQYIKSEYADYAK